MIRTEQLVCGYGRPVLHEVNLHLPPGEAAALLGPNGAGKSTLLLALCGLLRPVSGRVLLDGQPIGSYSARRRARLLAALPQNGHLPEGFTVGDAVLMGRYAHQSLRSGFGSAPSPEDHEAVRQALRETGMAHMAQRKCETLSGGEAQRALLARAFAQDARALLLDEAASGLDPARRMDAFDLLAAKNRQGLTIFCAVHDINLAAVYFPRLIFLKAGRVVLDGPTHEVFTSENLTHIYERDIRVWNHPELGVPQAYACVDGGAPVMGGSGGGAASGSGPGR